MDDRLKCVEKLNAMNSLLYDIKIGWDNRRYPTISVVKKIEMLQEALLDFNHWFLQYAARTKDDVKDYEQLVEILKKYNEEFNEIEGRE